MKHSCKIKEKGFLIKPDDDTWEEEYCPIRPSCKAEEAQCLIKASDET